MKLKQGGGSFLWLGMYCKETHANSLRRWDFFWGGISVGPKLPQSKSLNVHIIYNLFIYFPSLIMFIEIFQWWNRCNTFSRKYLHSHDRATEVTAQKQHKLHSTTKQTELQSKWATDPIWDATNPRQREQKGDRDRNSAEENRLSRRWATVYWVEKQRQWEPERQLSQRAEAESTSQERWEGIKGRPGREE